MMTRSIRAASVLPLSLLLACSGDDSSSATTGFTATGTTSMSTTTASSGFTTSTSGTSTAGTESGSSSSTSDTSGATTGTSTTGTSTTGVLPPVCGNGEVEEGEECDDGNTEDTDACTNACTSAICGDGVVQAGAEECDDGNTDDTDACVSTCKKAVCGDGYVGPGEMCDDGNNDDADECTNACAPAGCGDMIVQAGEECDDGNADDTDACLKTCKGAKCGDMAVQAGVEECDDGNADDTDACLNTCKSAKCGDGVVQAGKEECDDGNMVDNDMCSNMCKVPATCRNGAVEKSVSPGGTMKVCDHPNDAVCEQDQETLCPLGWHLCSLQEYNNRNTNWNYAVNGQTVVVGEIYCRGGGGAGHITLGPYGVTNLGQDSALNCGYGSARPDSCNSNYGCNEKHVQALCCSPNPKCGNGAVDDVEEQCDDGNMNETDTCLNSCTLRSPGC